MSDSTLNLTPDQLQQIIQSAVSAALAAVPPAAPEEPESSPAASEKPKRKPKASKRSKAPTSSQRARALAGLAKLYSSSAELDKAGPSFRNLAKAKARRWEATLRSFASCEAVLKDSKAFRNTVASLWEDGDFGAVAEAAEAHAAALWAAVPKKTANAVKDKALGLVNDGKASGFAMIQRVLG